MEFADRDLACSMCGIGFVFSAGEQQFFHDRGFTNDPKHCKQCKAKRTGTRNRARDTRDLLWMRHRDHRPIQADPKQTCAVQVVLWQGCKGGSTSRKHADAGIFFPCFNIWVENRLFSWASLTKWGHMNIRLILHVTDKDLLLFEGSPSECPPLPRPAMK